MEDEIRGLTPSGRRACRAGVRDATGRAAAELWRATHADMRHVGPAQVLARWLVARCRACRACRFRSDR